MKKQKEKEDFTKEKIWFLGQKRICQRIIKEWLKACRKEITSTEFTYFLEDEMKRIKDTINILKGKK